MFFFFNDTATTEIYTLSLHDALPIWRQVVLERRAAHRAPGDGRDRQHALQQRGALREELREVVGEERQSARHRDDRRPNAGLGCGERRADGEAGGDGAPRGAGGETWQT